MFSALKTRPETKKTANRRLNMEDLEGRSMMVATTLALDFTPDNSTGNFVDTFKYSRYSDGSAPRFLDFNGDRQITNQDVEIAAGQIRNAVGTYFNAPARGYSVSLTHGDVLTQSNFGARYLQYGQQRANEQVLVMYVGGRDGAGVGGRAPIAAAGYNVEGYGRTYTQEIAYSLMKNSSATKEHFVWTVAATIAHEYGHMFGLQHSRNAFGNDIMNPRTSNTAWTSVFSTYDQIVENGTRQNAIRELQYSFAGQPTYFGGSNRGGYQMTAEEHGHGGEHDDHHCDDEMDALIDSVMNAKSPKIDVSNLGSTSAIPLKQEASVDAAIEALSDRTADDLVETFFTKRTSKESSAVVATPLKHATATVATTLEDTSGRRSTRSLFTSVAKDRAIDAVLAGDVFATL